MWNCLLVLVRLQRYVIWTLRKVSAQAVLWSVWVCAVVLCPSTHLWQWQWPGPCLSRCGSWPHRQKLCWQHRPPSVSSALCLRSARCLGALLTCCRSTEMANILPLFWLMDTAKPISIVLSDNPLSHIGRKSGGDRKKICWIQSQNLIFPIFIKIYIFTVMLIADNRKKRERGNCIVFPIMRGLNHKSQSPLWEIIRLSA